jgi:hypothetical protein
MPNVWVDEAETPGANACPSFSLASIWNAQTARADAAFMSVQIHCAFTNI